MRFGLTSTWRIVHVVAAAAVLLVPALIVCGQNADRPAGEDDADAAQEASARLREGTKLDNTIGRFAINGDRVAFFSDDDQPALALLENLALERIAQMLTTVGEERKWNVSGTITEFQGKNYLLVSRAVVKNRTVSRSDDQSPEVDAE